MDPTPPEPPMLILAQYVKYFSFENPNAPEIYPAMSAKAPEITVNTHVTPFPPSERVRAAVPPAAVDQGAAPGRIAQSLRKIPPGLDAAQTVMQEDQRRRGVGAGSDPLIVQPIAARGQERHLFSTMMAVLF